MVVRSLRYATACVCLYCGALCSVGGVTRGCLLLFVVAVGAGDLGAHWQQTTRGGCKGRLGPVSSCLVRGPQRKHNHSKSDDSTFRLWVEDNSRVTSGRRGESGATSSGRGAPSNTLSPQAVHDEAGHGEGGGTFRVSGPAVRQSDGEQTLVGQGVEVFSFA